MRKFKGTLFEMHTSMHKHVAGQTLDYYPSDTKNFETFKKDIKYRFNNQGFRADHDIDENRGVAVDQPINAFIGCSNTMGIGVNLEETWCHHVNQRIGGVMINLGQAGGAAETCYRIVRHWLPIIRPKRLYMLSPPSVRREFWMPETQQPEIAGPRTSMPKILMADPEIDINRHRVLDAIRYHATINHVEFHYMHFRKIHDEMGEFMDFARDGMHPGPITHQHIAEQFDD